MIMTDVFNRSALLTIIVITALVGAIFLAGVADIGKETVQVRVGQHAIDRHGNDALRTRLAVFNCDPRYLQVFVHSLALGNPGSVGKWLFVCPSSTATLCAGMVVGASPSASGVYSEFTAFVSSCEYWLFRVPLRDGYISAKVVAVEKALSALVAMQGVEQCE